jgi:tetratricopeptide (TPR) repeat protein
VRAKSNRFASIVLLAAVGGCHGAPERPAPEAERVVAPPAARDAAPGATTPAAAAPGPGVADDNTPIPPRAAQQYAQALQSFKADRTTDAELEFKQLLAAYPQFVGPQLNLGLLYLRASRLAEAEAAFKAALKLKPDNPVAGNELGIVERKLGKFADAEAAYRQTLAAQPNYAPAHLNLGVLYDLYLDEPQKALDEFERYLAIVGDNKQVNGWVVELRKRVGAPAAAAKKEPA